jgi:hypothetical protein
MMVQEFVCARTYMYIANVLELKQHYSRKNRIEDEVLHSKLTGCM